jgi:hypothetical protein
MNSDDMDFKNMARDFLKIIGDRTPPGMSDAERLVFNFLVKEYEV